MSYLRFRQLSTVISHLWRTTSSDFSIVLISNSVHIALIDLGERVTSGTAARHVPQWRQLAAYHDCPITYLTMLQLPAPSSSYTIYLSHRCLKVAPRGGAGGEAGEEQAAQIAQRHKM